MKKLSFFVPLSKTEDLDDGSVMVYGYATTESLDHQGEIVKSDAVQGALAEYMKFANIREMHQPSAVGVAKSAEMDEKGLYLSAKIIDPVAVAKVKEGVYKGFSIGGKSLAKSGNAITQLRMTEISLVDRPANPDALIEVWKMGGVEGEEDGKEPGFDEETGGVKVGIAKGLYDVSRFAELLQSVGYLVETVEWETEVEGDNSMIPAKLREWLKQGVEVFSELAVEEVNELLATHSKADTDADIEKAGAKHAKAHKAALADLHDHLKKGVEKMDAMGYDKDEEEAEKAEGLPAGATKADADDAIQKVADEREAVLDEIAKALNMAQGDKYTDSIAKLHTRIKELEALPEPAKIKLHAVEKVDDGKQSDDAASALEKQLEGLTPDQMAIAVMKHIHQASR